MAITKTEEIAKIEVVQTCIIQVLLRVIISEDGQEISRSNKRYSWKYSKGLTYLTRKKDRFIFKQS